MSRQDVETDTVSSAGRNSVGYVLSKDSRRPGDGHELLLAAVDQVDD